MVAVIVVFILIGVIHMPDGPFVRPHPGRPPTVSMAHGLYICGCGFSSVAAGPGPQHLVCPAADLHTLPGLTSTSTS